MRVVQCLPIYRPLSNPWLKVQCLRVGSTINRGPPDTNFVGELGNPTSPKLTHTLQKLNTLSHEHRDTKQTHTTNNEGDPAQEGTEQEQNEHNAQIRAMQQKPPCSTPIKETQHRRTQNKTNEMPRLGPPNTEHKQTKTQCPD